MDHILRVRAEQQSSPRLCDDLGVSRSTRSADDASRVTLAMALAAIAFLSLFLSFSPFFFSVSGSPSPTLPARLVAVVVGGIFTSKTALFALSNVIFALLAADCRCRFDTTNASAGHAASSSSSGEPGGVMEKQARHHQVQVQVEQCGVQSCVQCSEILDDHDEQEGREDKSTMSANMLPDEEQLLEDLELELVRLGEKEEDSVTMEDEETVDVEEPPTCETAQGLDRLEISELNKKFDEFIRSRRIKWVNEEAYLLLCKV